MKFKVVTGKNLKLAGIEKDELWWGLHWQDFSTLLRKSIHLAYEMNHNQEEVDEVISGIVIESKFQSFEDNKLH